MFMFLYNNFGFYYTVSIARAFPLVKIQDDGRGYFQQLKNSLNALPENWNIKHACSFTYIKI